MEGGPSLAMVALQRSKQVAGGPFGGRASGGTLTAAALARREAPPALLAAGIALLVATALRSALASEVRPTLAAACAGLLPPLRPHHPEDLLGDSPVLGARAGELPVCRRRGGDLRDINLFCGHHRKI